MTPYDDRDRAWFHSQFKAARFAEGLNVAVARTGRTSTAENTRNPVGKTSFVRVLDFLLCSDVRTGHPLRRTDLADAGYA